MNAVIWQYERDEVGRLTAIADPLGRRRRFTYDEQGRLAGVAEAWQGAPQVELEYDGNGRVVRESVGGAVLRHTYDDAGRLSETGVEAPGRQPRSLGFEWDASGTLTRLRGEPVVLDAGGRAVSVGGRMRRWDAGGSDEEDDGDEPQPPSNEQPRILDLVSPVRITVSYGMEIDASHGRFRNVVTCKGTMTFWNVGTMAPGFGDASFTARCVASINGSETNESGRGTFSGGPNGTVTFVTDGMTIRASLRGGTTLSIPEVGTFPISPGSAFDNWPEKIP